MGTIDMAALGAVSALNLQSLFTAEGLGTVPPGTLASAGVASVQAQFAKNLQAGWPTNWPAYESSQQDVGIMGPWSENVAGTAPSCVVQQITSDFNNWELPVDPATISSMASQITQEISSNGGTTGTFYGRSREGGAETIYWGVAFGTAPIIDNSSEEGLIYVFTAQLGVN